MAQRSRGGGGKGTAKARGGVPRRNSNGNEAWQGGPWHGWEDSQWWDPQFPWPPSRAAQVVAVEDDDGSSDAFQMVAPRMQTPEEAVAATDASGAAATAESVLDALAGGLPPKAAGRRTQFVMADPRSPTQTPEGLMGPEKLLGHWVDSQGNAVHVLSTDAYDVRLVATLSRPPRADINLAVKPVVLGGGWQCGHSLLDPVWSSDQHLHWVAMDGRISVWVRPVEGGGEEDESQDNTEGISAPEISIASATAMAQAIINAV